MASLKKKTVTRPLPLNAEIKERRRKATGKELRQDPSRTTVVEKIACWRDRKGDKQQGLVVESADGVANRVRIVSDTWYAKYRDGDGIIREVPTGCRDKQAAMSVLNRLTDRAELVKAGVMTSDQADISDYRHTPLAGHIAEYVQHLSDRRVHPDRVKTTETRLMESAAACGFRRLADLSCDKLDKWLVEQANDPSRKASAAVCNGYCEVWVAFGNWCTGKRMSGKKSHMNGEKRLLVNPFEGIRRRDARQERRRVARAMTEAELTKLIDAAMRRPLLDALTVRRGANAGKPVANISDEQRQRLEKLGRERALIYKTFLLTGLRADELRTLSIADLSFGDVPFIHLRHSNEKSRKGSTIPLRSDLAAELRKWTEGRSGRELVFNVPTGILRILNRDLALAGIPKADVDGCVVHIHALRHSFGTHLSLAGVAPRVAQAVMRHSDIKLTMNTYTDSRLLDTAAAVESLKFLSGDLATVAPTVAPDADSEWHFESLSDNLGKPDAEGADTKKPGKTLGFPGFSEVGATGFEPATSASRTQRSTRLSHAPFVLVLFRTNSADGAAGHIHPLRSTTQFIAIHYAIHCDPLRDSLRSTRHSTRLPDRSIEHRRVASGCVGIAGWVVLTAKT